MEIKSIRECLYKDEGEFSILFDSVKEVNNNFKLLLDVKKTTIKKQLHNTALSNLEGDEKIRGVVLIDKLVELIFKDIKQCHRKVYE